MKKSFTVTVMIVLVLITSLAFTRDEPRYKNLKVLPKNITPEQMDSVMHHFTDALNVKCTFCHVKRDDINEMDFVSDENKHKLIARDMMRMTKKINKKYFDVTGEKMSLSTPLMVTCYTCHNGSAHPATRPPKTND